MYVMVLFVDFYLAGDTRQENRRQHISVSASGTLCIQRIYFQRAIYFYGTVSPSQGSKKCSDVSMHICYSRGVLEPRVTHRSLVIFLFAYVRDGFLYSFLRHGIIAANAQHNWLKSFPGLCFCKGVLILSL